MSHNPPIGQVSHWNSHLHLLKDRSCSRVRKANNVTNPVYGNFDMCRNIKTLFNFDPPATEEEIRAASLQFVRKLSGFHKPTRANQPAFNAAIESVTEAATQLLSSLVTTSKPKNREVEAEKARMRTAKRFG